jgi:hypothetical protein
LLLEEGKEYHMKEARSRIGHEHQSLTTRVVVGGSILGAVLTGCGEQTTGVHVVSDPTHAASDQPTKSKDTTTTPPPERGPVDIKPNLCPVIPDALMAQVLGVAVDSNDFRAASREGLDASQIPNEQNMIANCQLQATLTTGVYTSVYTESQMDMLEKTAEEHDITMPKQEPIEVNGEVGSYMPDTGLAEVPFKNGPAEFYLNVNAGFNVPAETLEKYMAGVEEALFSPQAAQ